MFSEKGQSLMELVVVIAVMVVVIGALTFATIASLRNAQFSKNQAQATKLAQEGLEWVRTGRDRNACISNLDGFTTVVNSWNGSIACPVLNGSGKLWDYKITGSDSAVHCDYEPASPIIPSQCYFKILSTGVLQNIGQSSTFPITWAEKIPQSIFSRVVTLSDDASWQNQKQVTVIVTWTDFSGSHESRISTILRRI